MIVVMMIMMMMIMMLLLMMINNNNSTLYFIETNDNIQSQMSSLPSNGKHHFFLSFSVVSAFV